MSGIEVVGLVLGAFPILLKCLAYYREGFEPLEEWWQFRSRFLDFSDNISHEMMKYRGNMLRLLESINIHADDYNLMALLELPTDQIIPKTDLGKSLETYLGSELDRFLRIIGRMHELMMALFKLLQIAWFGTNQERTWQWQLKRIQISFSKGKHKKIQKVAVHNQELEDILGYTERIIPISDKVKISEPVTRFEKLRQHACSVHRTLTNRWRCQQRCQNHFAHLSLRAEELEISLNVMFGTTVAKGPTEKPWLQEVVIRSEAMSHPTSINLRHLRQSGPFTTDNRATTRQKPSPQANKRIINRLSERFRNSTPAATVSSSQENEASGEAKEQTQSGSNVSESSRAQSCMLKQVESSSEKADPSSIKSMVELGANPLPSINVGLKPVDDLCGFLMERNQVAALLLGDDPSQAIKLSKPLKEQQVQDIDNTRLLSFPELLEAYHNASIDISRQTRFEMATHISSALLQTHLSPWLSYKWTKSDFYFLIDVEARSVYSRYPLVSREFASALEITNPADHDRLQDPPAHCDEQEETRARLFTLGVMILELMFGHNIEACQFRREYFGVDGRPNDQTDVSTARRWSRRVTGESGPDMSEVVRRCLDCSFGPQPSFADGRFREAIYANVIRPLASYSKMWPEVRGAP